MRYNKYYTPKTTEKLSKVPGTIFPISEASAARLTQGLGSATADVEAADQPLRKAKKV
jgi:hypothetical protein